MSAIAKRSLSTKLLLLTIVFVFVAEFVVLVPSIAKQRRDWFNLRFEEAYLASLALEGPREAAADETLVRRLFNTANILGVTINSDDMRMLILAPEINPHGAPDIVTVDLTSENWFDLIANAWGTMLSSGDHLIQATGAPQFAPSQTVDIIVSQGALRDDLLSYARNIFLLSLIISTLTASFVYWALNRIIVWPVKRLTANIMAFDADPENAQGILTPSGRSDEIGAAEESLAAMEKSVRGLLGERRRLAALGAGISKISHDLRNVLASAQLMSDRLAKSDDPSVRKLAPRLISALDRAIGLSRDTLTYGRMETRMLEKSPIVLHELVEEVFEDTAAMGVTAQNNTPEDLTLIADRTQLYRTLFNLVRNAIEAMTGAANDEDKDDLGKVSIDVDIDGRDILITIADTGPGLPDHAKEELFEPFKGSQKPGGSGLGVAISAEIARAHGGSLTLHKSDEEGAAFRLRLPQDD
ncbi:sensor histidine kinase [Hyphococcus luteus]|uniref:histidine kinase n=1 Tax=Hyphococcus luteus TaxID=2058213 RepID=A0A2S7K9N4_9PROT|nr:HAMP domain-containing sensor histidine kinase [Marinicaulis flavus]PQA89198.1 histidine kinase [Marinicaulis flavus]